MLPFSATCIALAYDIVTVFNQTVADPDTRVIQAGRSTTLNVCGVVGSAMIVGCREPKTVEVVLNFALEGIGFRPINVRVLDDSGQTVRYNPRIRCIEIGDEAYAPPLGAMQVCVAALQVVESEIEGQSKLGTMIAGALEAIYANEAPRLELVVDNS